MNTFPIIPILRGASANPEFTVERFDDGSVRIRDTIDSRAGVTYPADVIPELVRRLSDLDAQPRLWPGDTSLPDLAPGFTMELVDAGGVILLAGEDPAPRASIEIKTVDIGRLVKGLTL